jgi:hypothetical protein
MSLLVERFVREAGGPERVDQAAAERFVGARVAALPGVPRAGVRLVETALGARLRLARTGAERSELAERWLSSKAPGVAEYVRLVRSLAVVFAFDESAPRAA